MKDEKSKITAVAIEKMIDFYQGNENLQLEMKYYR